MSKLKKKIRVRGGKTASLDSKNSREGSQASRGKGGYSGRYSKDKNLDLRVKEPIVIDTGILSEQKASKYEDEE